LEREWHFSNEKSSGRGRKTKECRLCEENRPKMKKKNELTRKRPKNGTHFGAARGEKKKFNGKVCSRTEPSYETKLTGTRGGLGRRVKKKRKFGNFENSSSTATVWVQAGKRVKRVPGILGSGTRKKGIFVPQKVGGCRTPGRRSPDRPRGATRIKKKIGQLGKGRTRTRGSVSQEVENPLASRIERGI